MKMPHVMALEHDLDVFVNEVLDWSRHNFDDQPAWKPLLGIGEEVGELNHAFLKMEQSIRGSETEHREAMFDAVGDIMVFLADFCGRMGISLGDATTYTWEAVSRRDWKQFPKNGLTE